MTIVRGAGEGDKVVTILRTAAQDARLSFRARGVLVAVMSRPKDWRTDYRRLAGEGREGERAVLGALAELEQFGYLRRERVHNGRHIVTAWEISDRPGRRFLQPTKVQPTKQQPTKVQRTNVQPTNLQGLQEGETEGDTPPPTPTPAGPHHERVTALGALVVVVGEAIEGRAPTPARGVLLATVAPLHDAGWTPDELRAAVARHDWSGARAGAVVAYLRGLTAADRVGAAGKPARKRPDWCGRCDETTRLQEEPQSGRQRRCPPQRRCPDCHPLAAKARRTP